jgi:hypothetical protein
MTTGVCDDRTLISIDINLTRTKVIFPRPKDMGAIFFDDENNLIVNNIDRGK